MYGQHIVAIFPSAEPAIAAKNQLIGSGFDDSSMRLSCDRQGRGGESTLQGFFDWLFGSDVPEKEREWYSNTLKEGRTALSIRVEDLSAADRIEPMLINAGAIEVEKEDDERSGTPTQSGDRKPTASASASGEEVIPVVKEELQVGKRTKEDRHVIRTHVIERPVEEQVNLRDETVVIERRPASGQAAKPDALQEREYEVMERHEEPVAQKTAKAVEEVVVKKDVKDRTETVKDKVRETEVEAGKKPGSGSRQ